MEIFQKSVIKKYLQTLDESQIKPAYQKFLKFYGNKARVQNITLLKEENYQEGFLREIFVQVLGYTINPDENYNLTTEFKNLTDTKKADAAILKDGKAIAVIELKSTQTKNLESIKQQAFNYKNNQPDCKYVITSNFQFLRFYIDNATEFEEFDLFRLTEAEFSKLYLILSKESIFSDLPARLKQETQFHEQRISDQFYQDYSAFKRKIFHNLVANNPQYDKLLLFKKSQKLLDRLLFVFFAEDRGLVPPNAIARIIDQWTQLKDLEAYQPLYDRFKLLFTHLDKGHKYKNYELPAYDGGLFEPDEILDNVIIDDEILHQDSLKLSAYDFDTEIDVNILGHIFEHSLNEIEEITAELEGAPIDKKKTKRKKEGIFYTPKYITQYIVENTVGALCQEKKTELGIADVGIDESHRRADGKISRKGKQLFQQLNQYKDWLLSLKILDPACGSGAFLNQALDFLIDEHKANDALINQLTDQPLGLFDTDKAILENNLYGVDINEESVEIAKLSLWLRTARKGRKLSMLNNNIKCGNSLIDDPAVAGDKAFDWNKEFPDIMGKGGFDVVIGNPPYGASLSVLEKKLFKKVYSNVHSRMPDSFNYFISRAFFLLKEDGLISLIVPNNLLYQNEYSKARNLLLSEKKVISIVNFGDKVFRDATVPTCIFVVKNEIQDDYVFYYNDFRNMELSSIQLCLDKKINPLSKMDVLQIPAYVFGVEKAKQNILNKIEKMSKKIDDIADEVANGIQPTGDKIFRISYEYARINNFEKEILKDVIVGGDFSRYHLIDPHKYVIYTIKELDIAQYPIIFNYLSNYREKLSKKRESRKGILPWWCLHWPRYPKLFEEPKIVIRQTADNIIATFDDLGFYTMNNVIILKLKTTIEKDYKFVLTILNSTLTKFIYNNLTQEDHRVFAEVKPKNVRKLFIPIISSKEKQILSKKANLLLVRNKQFQDLYSIFYKRLLSNIKVEKITSKLSHIFEYDFNDFISELRKQKINLSLKQQDEWEDYFNDYKQKITDLKRQIDQTDREIDQMVYELYDLTAEEIEIVEKSY